jgi:hypothetical protein
LPQLLEAFGLAASEHTEVRLEPHGDCGGAGLQPFVPPPPHTAGTTPVLHPCDAFFRRRPEEAAVALGVELLYLAGLPDARDDQGRRQGVPEVSGRIRKLLGAHRGDGEANPYSRPARPLWGLDARLVDLARERAMRRLRHPECRSLLTDFVDGEGRSLAENLEPYAVPADEYLGQLALLSGSGHPLCDRGQARLVTTPNAKRIFVCKPFVAIARSQPYEAEVALIHDMLHTLGLGENPPTTVEITQRVKRRCPRGEP